MKKVNNWDVDIQDYKHVMPQEPWLEVCSFSFFQVLWYHIILIYTKMGMIKAISIDVCKPI